MYVTVALKLDVDATWGIDELEQHIQEAGRAVMQEALKQALQKLEEQHMACPHCSRSRSRGQGTKTRVLLTAFGRVEVPLRRSRCLHCGRRFRPAQACLSALGGHNITPHLRQVAALVGSSWPYATAAGVLHQLCGTHISDESLRQITNEEGTLRALQELEQAKQVVAPTMQQIRSERDEEARRKQHRERPKQPEWLQVGLDGGWIPSRDQAGGMEGKIAVLACAGEPVGKRGRHRLTERRYVATFANAEQVGMLAYAAAYELNATEASKQVVLGDGAEWIKQQATEQFPQAKPVLDWAHLWRKIHDAMRAVHPGKSPARRAWRKQQYEVLKSLLWQGLVEDAVVHLQTLRPTEGSEPIKRLEDAIRYLQTQRDWIGNYEQLRTEGYPIGSGLVERAVAIVINTRMKKRGMRWKRGNATAVVTLRVQQINAHWHASSAVA